MQVTVLGCRGGMPANGQPSSGYLVDTGTSRILLDCGPGIATALSAEHDPSTLDAVVISHLHLDHCYDLLPIGKALLSPLAHYPGADGESERPVELPLIPLFVPAGVRSLLNTWASLFPVETIPLLDQVFSAAFDIREYRPDDRMTLGDTTLEFVELRHAKPNCGVRVTAPAGSVAYTGDTGVTEALVRLAAGIDLFIAEASLEQTDHGVHGHLCAADAARAAAEAKSRELLLTHFPTADDVWLKARLSEATELFGGRIRLARPGAVYPIG